MVYQINPQMPIPDEIERIVREEIADALKNLTENDDVSAGIHEARKSMKKLRGILHLVRRDLKPKRYERENARFRDAGRMLAQARDSYVIYETLDILRPHLSTADRKTLNALRRHYKQRYQVDQSVVLADTGDVETVQQSLQKGIESLSKWKISDGGFETLSPNIEATYLRGVKGYQRSQKHHEPDIFHEWRKQVKYLWYHVRLLVTTWDSIMKPLADELKQLSDLLGVAHDLTVVASAIVSFADDYDIVPLIKACDEERQRLENEALTLGMRIYAEAPSAFVGRLRVYWHSD